MDYTERIPIVLQWLFIILFKSDFDPNGLFSCATLSLCPSPSLTYTTALSALESAWTLINVLQSSLLFHTSYLSIDSYDINVHDLHHLLEFLCLVLKAVYIDMQTIQFFLTSSFQHNTWLLLSVIPDSVQEGCAPVTLAIQ